MRYGDDFVLFVPNLNQAILMQELATHWLDRQLKLRVHIKNNVVIPANTGLHFLGHKIYAYAPLAVIDPMATKIYTTISITNAASYKSMHVPARKSKKLPWLLLQSVPTNRVIK
jgi:hypothetical protein